MKHSEDTGTIEQKARELPLLPMHKGLLTLHNTGGVSQFYGYTEKQMVEYATAAITALAPPDDYVMVRRDMLEDLASDAELYVHGTEHRPDRIEHKLASVREAKAILFNASEAAND